MDSMVGSENLNSGKAVMSTPEPTVAFGDLVKFSLQLSVSSGCGVNQLPASLGLLVSVLLDLLSEQVLDRVGSRSLAGGNIDRETPAEDKGGLAERHHSVWRVSCRSESSNIS